MHKIRLLAYLKFSGKNRFLANNSNILNVCAGNRLQILAQLVKLYRYTYYELDPMSKVFPQGIIINIFNKGKNFELRFLGKVEWE